MHAILLAAALVPGLAEPARVVVARGPETEAPALVRTGLARLLDADTDTAAWRQLVTSNDVVGLKVSTQAAPVQATRRAVVDALVDGVVAAGVARTNIWVFDRDPGKLRAAGYTGPQAVGVIGELGWDREQFYESRLVGRLIWGDALFGTEELSTRSHWPRLVTRTITKLINVPVLQDHEAYGLAGCLHNITVGLVDNHRRFDSARPRADASLAEIAAQPAGRDKVVLHVLDALVAGYAGGSDFKPRYSWPAGALYFSRDPVAVDTVALELLEAKRCEQNIPARGAAAATHLEHAHRLGLGQNDRRRIELVEAAAGR